jgi:hypothetical protein
MSRIDEIRERQEERRKRCEFTVRGTDIPLPRSIADIDYLLSVVKNDSAEDRGRVISALADVLSTGVPTSTEEGNNSHMVIPRDYFDNLGAVHRELVEARATAPTETSARCAKCAECGHKDQVGSDGFCRFTVLVDPCKGETDYCNCECVFPASTEQAGELVDEVQHRMDSVVERAVEWHQAGREGAEWFDKAEALSAAIEFLLELRTAPAPLVVQPQRLYRTRYCDHCQTDHNYFIGWSNDDHVSNMQTEQGGVSQTLPQVDTGSNDASKTQIDTSAQGVAQANVDQECAGMAVGVAQPEADPARLSGTCLACEASTNDPYCAECTERYRAIMGPSATTPTTAVVEAEHEPDIYDAVAEFRQRFSDSTGSFGAQSETTNMKAGIDVIIKRRDEAALTTKEKGWIHTRSPTWTDIDNLLSFINLVQFQLFAAREANRLGDVEIERLKGEVGQLKFDLHQARTWIAGVEEREAAVCPEDIGFDEYIRTLQKQLAVVRADAEPESSPVDQERTAKLIAQAVADKRAAIRVAAIEEAIQVAKAHVHVSACDGAGCKQVIAAALEQLKGEGSE